LTGVPVTGSDVTRNLTRDAELLLR